MPKPSVLFTPIAQRVRSLLEARGFSNIALARRLNLSPSVFYRACVRPNALHAHIDQIAAFFSLTSAQLMADASVPPAPTAPTAPIAVAADAPKDKAVKLPPSCLLVPLIPDSTQSRGPYHQTRWALLGPQNLPPEPGQLVAFLDDEGYRLRGFEIDASGVHVILTAKGSQPQVFPIATAPQLRVVMMLGERMKFSL